MTGAKAWAILAYLLLVDGNVDRRRLAMLLFPDAADPAASLRWNLSQLRRGLGIALDGDRLRLTLPANTWLHVEALAHGETVAAAAIALREQILLDGVVPDGLDAYGAWLEGERRHGRTARDSGAAGCLTPTCGSRPTASTRWPMSPASVVSMPPRTGSINSRNSASATACVPCAPMPPTTANAERSR